MGKKLYNVAEDGKVTTQDLGLPVLTDLQTAALRIGISKEHPTIDVDAEFSLRPLRTTDAADLSAALYDPAHPTNPAKSPAIRLSNLGQPFDEAAARAYIDEMQAAQQPNDDLSKMGFGMAIVRKVDGAERVVGFYDVFMIEEGSADIGVALAPECQSKALGRSVYNDLERAFIDHLFDDVQVPRVLGTTALDNATILAVWAKRGQERLGFSANQDSSTGAMLPRHISILTSDGWKAHRENRADSAPSLAAAARDMQTLSQAITAGETVGDAALTQSYADQLPRGIAEAQQRQKQAPGAKVAKPDFPGT